MFTNRFFYLFVVITTALAAVIAFTVSRIYHESTEQARLENSLSLAQSAGKYENRYDHMNDSESATNASRYEDRFDLMNNSDNSSNVSRYEDRFDLMNDSANSYDASKHEDRYDRMN